MRRSAIIQLSILCLFIFPIKTNAQDAFSDGLQDITGKWEVGITGGSAAFFGDLGGNRGKGQPFIKDFNSQTARPIIGAHINYFYYNWLNFKLAVNFTNVNGADSLVKDDGNLERWRLFRNLSFRSSIAEANISAEVYPFMLLNADDDIKRINPYIAMGIGLFHFNPQTRYQGQWIDLQPLRLEGEGFAEYPGRKMYKLLQVYIPVTIGVKVYVDNIFALSAGITFRHTFTDYIDDIHTTYIDPSLFDKYSSAPNGLLTAQQAAMAKQLFSRSLTPWKVLPGVLKANPANNDSYTNIFLSLSIRISSGPKFYVGG